MEEYKIFIEAIKNGYALPFIIWFLWGKKQEQDDEKEIHRKKQTGEFVSWENMDERLKAMADRVKTFDIHLKEEQLEEGRFVKLESGHENLKENINDIKDTLQEIKMSQRDMFQLIADVKNVIIQQKQ